MDDEAFSLEQRVLCSDGACIGVVGPDGRCKRCGKAYEGTEPVPAVENDHSPDPMPTVVEVDPAGQPHPEPSERVCCPDERCIGIIGEDGKCGTCGKAP